MFIASKFEDIYPLKMKTIHEKIAHKKLEISAIKKLELEILKTIDYKIHAPTVLDFLKVYLKDVLGIRVESRTDTKKKE
jgi:cyclin B/cyclin A